MSLMIRIKVSDELSAFLWIIKGFFFNFGKDFHSSLETKNCDISLIHIVMFKIKKKKRRKKRKGL